MTDVSRDSLEIFMRVPHNSCETFVPVSHNSYANVAVFSQSSREMSYLCHNLFVFVLHICPNVRLTETKLRWVCERFPHM